MAFTDRTKLSEYDATAANNINLGTAASPAARLGEYGVDLDAEAMRPSDTNGALRELMKHLKDMDAGTSALTAPNLGKPTLEAIDTSITATALDVFVYDTSKDSDGGAWRKRCQHTSWYNETLNTATRGSRREFPAVAVIVAEATKVTIYDGDDPALPMWIVFNGAVSHSIFLGYSSPGGFSVTMRDGHFCVGITGSSTNGSINGLAVANFVADTLSKYDEIGFAKSSQGIADRNDNAWLSGMGWWSIAKDTTKKIVNQYVNDVSLTVLPDAPIDPATGLQVPTIAVATDGGVSVIKDDGTVVDSAAATVSAVAINEDLLSYVRVDECRVIALSNVISDGFTYDRRYNNGPTYSASFLPQPLNGSNKPTFFGEKINFAASNGISSLFEDSTSQTKGMVNYTTSTYNTGWMNGNIKLAALADTDDTDLVGSGELVAASDDLVSQFYPAEWTLGIGTASVTSISSGDRLWLFGVNTENLAAGTYVVQFTVGAGTSAVSGLYFNGAYLTTNMTTGTRVVTFTTDGTKGNPFFFLNAGASLYLTDVSVKLADKDRSVNNNSLIINGTVSRDPVATGADVVAYSGFSASNYLEQPYNPDLDFADGDFCVMAWVKTSSSAKMAIAARYDRTNTNADFYLNKMNTNTLAFEVNGAIVAQSTSLINDGAWHYAVAVRKSGLVKLYLDGSQVASAANTSDLDNASGILGVGVVPVTTPVLPFDGSIALLRISATAPTADQIRKIYEDERPLFQENAKATLTGNSDAVTALAHDPDTDLLHVGTSGGRSVFQGLRRVEEHTDTDNQSLAAISAVDGLVVEGK